MDERPRLRQDFAAAVGFGLVISDEIGAFGETESAGINCARSDEPLTISP
jgi:hypothetical protein